MCLRKTAEQRTSTEGLRLALLERRQAGPLEQGPGWMQIGPLHTRRVAGFV